MKLTKKQVTEIENKVLDIIYNQNNDYSNVRVVEHKYTFNDGFNIIPYVDFFVYFEWLENPEAEPKDIKVHRVKVRYTEEFNKDKIYITTIDLEGFNYDQDIIE